MLNIGGDANTNKDKLKIIKVENLEPSNTPLEPKLISRDLKYYIL